MKSSPREFIRLSLKPIIAGYDKNLGLVKSEDLLNKMAEEILRIVPDIVELQLTRGQLDHWSWDVIKRNIMPANASEPEEVRCGECGAIYRSGDSACEACGETNYNEGEK